jgi:hypothetical protein
MSARPSCSSLTFLQQHINNTENVGRLLHAISSNCLFHVFLQLPFPCLPVIKNYRGVRFPNWIKGPKLGTSFPKLVHLDLENCISCTKLPSLGLLDQLKSLQISNADSVVTIGSEFLKAYS